MKIFGIVWNLELYDEYWWIMFGVMEMMYDVAPKKSLKTVQESSLRYHCSFSPERVCTFANFHHFWEAFGRSRKIEESHLGALTNPTLWKNTTSSSWNCCSLWTLRHLLTYGGSSSDGGISQSSTSSISGYVKYSLMFSITQACLGVALRNWNLHLFLHQPP